MISGGVEHQPARTRPPTPADTGRHGPTPPIPWSIAQPKREPRIEDQAKPAHGRKIDFNSNAVQIISCPVEDWAERIQTMAALERTQRNRHERERYLA